MDDTNTSAPLPQFEGETQTPPTPVPNQVETTTVNVEVTDPGMNENPINGGGVGGGEGEVAEDGDGGESRDADPQVTVRRKRGRPRKHQVESPECLPSLQKLVPKGGRGRPPGTGKLQSLATMGRLAVHRAGGNLIPHVLNVQVGEDIVDKLLSVVPMGPQAVCILSAAGSISTADIRPPGFLGFGILRREGHFPILTLSGTYMLTEAGQRIGSLSVSLADIDASVFGGLVVGSLVAAEPTQIILGSFNRSEQNILKVRSSESPTATAESTTAAVGLRGFRVPPTVVKLPKIEEKFSMTSLPNGNAHQDVKCASLESSNRNTSPPSDQFSSNRA